MFNEMPVNYFAAACCFTAVSLHQQIAPKTSKDPSK